MAVTPTSHSAGAYHSGFATTVADTTTSAVGAGRKIIAVVSWYGTAASVTLSGGGLTWTPRVQSGGTTRKAAIITADALTGLASGTTITATFSATTEAKSLRIFSCDGLMPEGIGYDTGIAGADGTATSWSNTITTANADDVVFGFTWADFYTSGITPTSPATEVAEWTDTDGGSREFVYYETNSTGSMTIGGTFSGSRNNVSAAIALKKAMPWVNRVTIALPRNGTTSHTADPSSGSVVAGKTFTPTAGNLLVALCYGAVTSGSTTGVPANPPTGWTKPTNGEAVNNGGLYVWYKTAAGSDTAVLNHNGSDYPVVVEFFEFPAGSTVDKVAQAISVAQGGGNNPALSGLSGSNLILRAVGKCETNTPTTDSASWASTTKLVDTAVFKPGTDGYHYSLAYQDGFSGSSASTVAATLTGGSSTTTERLTIAVTAATAAAGDNSGTLSATTPKVTASISGTQVNAGTLSASTPRTTSSVPGTQTNSAALAAQTILPTGSVAGSQTNSGSLADTTPVLTGSMSGTQANPGATSASAPLLASSVTATQVNAATLSGTVPLVVGSMNEAVANNGIVAGTLPTLSGSLTGMTVNSGSLSAALPSITGAASGTQTNAATLAASTRPLTGSITGAQLNSGSLAATLRSPPVTASITGNSINPATLAPQLPLLTTTLTASQVNSGSLTVALPVLRGYLTEVGAANSGTLVASTPLLTTALTASQTVTASLSATLRPLTGAVSGTVINPGAVSPSLPVLTATVSGQQSNPATLIATLPLLTGLIIEPDVNRGELDGELPLLTGSIIQQVTNLGTLDATLPLLTATFGTYTPARYPRATIVSVSGRAGIRRSYAQARIVSVPGRARIGGLP
jgi:hypothetical protein